jgi:hypothetical protein
MAPLCRAVDTAAEIQALEMEEFVSEFSSGYVDSREVTCATASFALTAFVVALAVVFLVDTHFDHLHAHAHAHSH